MSEEEFIELTGHNQRAEALLTKCADTLAAINEQMPENPSYVFHKEKLQVVADSLRNVTAQVHLVQSTLNRIYPEAKE